MLVLHRRLKRQAPNTACSGLAGTQGIKGQVLNPPTANASRWHAPCKREFRVRMDQQHNQIEMEEKPDKLAFAILITSILIGLPIWICGIVWYFLAGGFPQYILLFILLGVFGIIYGLIRTITGSITTKQFAKANVRKMGFGALAGSLVAFTAIIIAQITAMGGFWDFSSLFLITIPGALFFGIPAGGIGGMILGNKGKTNKASIIGGIIAGVILAPFLFFLFSFRG